MEIFDNPSLTLAVALTIGLVAQAVARHLQFPGIVLLLATGVLLGPDVLGVVQPDALGRALTLVVGFAVAVILFEGGMNLTWAHLKRQQGVIWSLVFVGGAVTLAGAALTARYLMGWPWPLAALFGTLVIVTGPTVVTPLLRRLAIKREVATVLEAEGVLIDAVGAISAVVALELVLVPTDAALPTAAVHVATRLGFGLALGLGAGLLLALILRFRNLIPEGLENVFTLAWVLVVFQLANGILPESGLAAAPMAGLVVGNTRWHAQRDLLEFKEQLTVMLIGMLFVLLAADVRVADVVQLGWPGVATVACLVLLLRPLAALVGTARSGLGWREKTFIGWIAPRGIVAAAVASLFAEELARFEIDGGEQLRALVFLVIAVTVFLAGFTGGPVARLLALQRKRNAGWVILGANALGRTVGRVLARQGEEVVVVDSNPASCAAAQADGLRVIYGNALEERTLRRAEIDTRYGAIGLVANEEVNLLFAQKAKREGKLRRLFVGLRGSSEGVTPAMVEQVGAQILFGKAQDVSVWSMRLRHHSARVEEWTLLEPAAATEDEELELPPLARSPDGLFLPVIVNRAAEQPLPVSRDAILGAGDRVTFILNTEREDEAVQWLTDLGWRRTPGPVDLQEKVTLAS